MNFSVFSYYEKFYIHQVATGMNPLLLIFAILPGLGICYAIYRIDKYEAESPLPLLISFFLGVIVTFPALKIEATAESYGLVESSNFWMTLVLAFGGVAFTEELLKYICLLAYPWPRKFFNEPLDGITYAVMIGMGFATLENIIYAYQFGITTVAVRAFTAVPAHAVFAIFAGYFAGKAKFASSPERFKLLVYGFLLAVGIHGLYDFFILQQHFEWLMIFSTVVLFFSAFMARKLLIQHKEKSPFKPAAAPVLTVPNTGENEKLTTDEIMDAIIADMNTDEEE